MSGFLDLIFPKRCVGCRRFGSFICSDCFSLISFETVPICPICNKNSVTGATHPFCKTSLSIDGLTTGVVYKGIVKKLVYQFKYSPHLSSLRENIGKLFCESLEQQEIFYNLLRDKPVVVVVPLHKNKLKKRGYNHAEIIGSYVAKYFGLEFVPDVLIRTKETKPQYKLSKKQRFENIKGAFNINENLKKDFREKSILLIDDLATTCVTLNECAKVLKKSGARRVWGVTFARE